MYEFDPDERNGPSPYQLDNEERLLVLAGTPTLRHPEGRDGLAVGDMVLFPEVTGSAGRVPRSRWRLHRRHRQRLPPAPRRLHLAIEAGY